MPEHYADICDKTNSGFRTAQRTSRASADAATPQMLEGKCSSACGEHMTINGAMCVI